jgi:hypothetical protein
VSRRWRYLFCFAVANLLAVAWFAAIVDVSLWLTVPAIGTIATAAIAFIGMVTASRKRWLAAVALLCIAPMGQILIQTIPSLHLLLSSAGSARVLLRVLLVLSTTGALASAGYLLFVSPPPLPEDRIPIARATR